MVKRLPFVLLLLLFAYSTVQAQNATVSGTVVDESSGQTLPGVNIMLEDTQQGDATDSEGEFEITDVEPGEYTITASYVGYNTYEETIEVEEGDTEIEISLVSDTEELDEVVVTAMGQTRTEESVSTAIQEVSGDDLNLTDNTNLAGSLSGKVSGVQVVSTPGSNIGGSEKIRIRGANGLSDEQPLFVVDGTPISNESFSPQAVGRDYGNLIQDLNLDDVESISVLKGAAASALYGNRASGGVVEVTTKGGQAGEQEFQVDYENNTRLEEVHVLPNYQNEYAGGYNQEFSQVEDPEDGETYNVLNYAADESWGPRMDGETMYRPWYSWFHGDFTGDGEDDYGDEIPLEPNPDNVRNFYETGVRTSNSLAISGGSENSAFRASIENSNHNGVIPNSTLGKTILNFNGVLTHNDRFTSRLTFNYANTQGVGRPTQGYSPAQGNATQSYNQWFQRQLSMDELKNYRLEDGTIASWNIQSPTNTEPLYWDSPYFTHYENVPEDDRDRFYGNFSLNYDIASNLQATATIHGDFYDFVNEDRIASGGLDEDWYSTTQRNRREMNYEGSLQYQEDFTEDISFEGYLGANLRQEKFVSMNEETVGGLSSDNFFNIDASIDRPDVSNTTNLSEVRSIYGTANVGYQDLFHGEITMRNDWSSTLPQDDNSYFYYGLSGNFVFTELDAFDDQNLLSYGKLRASIAQVGQDVDPYRVLQTYNVTDPRGGYAAMTVPNSRPNPDLRAAVSSDYELGAELAFFDDRLYLDGTYYQSVKEDEILDLQVPPASGYNELLVNAGEFVTSGVEVQMRGSVIQTQDWDMNLTLNWSTSKSQVNELAEGLDTRELEYAYFGPTLYAEEGKEWGQIVSGGYVRDDETGEPIFNPSTGHYEWEDNVNHGSILPDWNGGFRLDASYKNFNLATFVEFQKGGQFYSISKMFGNNSGMLEETVGTNELGNPIRDPLVDQDGNEPDNPSIPYDEAGENSGGMLVEGSDGNGNTVQYLTDPQAFYDVAVPAKEAYIYDASYIKLKEVTFSYDLPSEFVERFAMRRASLALEIQNPLLLYSSTDGIDPSTVQNGNSGFSWWEGGTTPGVRSVGLNINLGF